MRLGFVDHWFVEILGSHNAFKEEASSPASSTNSDPKQMEAADYTVATLDSASPLVPDELQHRDSPAPEVATLLRQNGASTAATALCDPFRGSPPVLYLASHLNIPVFPEPFSISSHHIRRHQHQVESAGTTENTAIGRSQPQTSSLDLRIKPDPEVGASKSASDIQDTDSPMELTAKVSSPNTIAKNGHVATYHTSPSSWPERTELLKSYINSKKCHSNGNIEAQNSDVSEEKDKEFDLITHSSSVAKKYWTYQFSAAPSEQLSPNDNENNADKTMIDDDDDDGMENNLVIDDGISGQHGEDNGEDGEDDKVLISAGGGHILEWIIPPFIRFPPLMPAFGNTACACCIALRVWSLSCAHLFTHALDVGG